MKGPKAFSGGGSRLRKGPSTKNILKSPAGVKKLSAAPSK